MEPCVSLKLSLWPGNRSPSSALPALSCQCFSATLFFFFLVPQCPLQAKYWNSSVNEVEGTITDNKGKVIHRLFGKWHEAVFCGAPPSATCVWRASTTLFALLFVDMSSTSL